MIFLTCRLVRITSADYRDFRRAYSKIEYSFFKKGEEQPRISESVREMIQFAIKGKGEFLDWVENPETELYFFKIDDEIKGIVELVFFSNTCTIHNFSVFEHLQGLGTILFHEVLNIVKEYKCKKITLWCPYEGAQIFWRKQGFSQKPKFFFEKRM